MHPATVQRLCMAQYKRTRPLGHGLQEIGGDPALGAGVVAHMHRPLHPRPVLLSCADQELHSLPLLAVPAGLAERHVGSRVLGARVPGDALVAAIRRTGPAVVLLWSTMPPVAAGDRLAELPSMRPAPLVLAAGPGWPAPLPDGVSRVDDLVGALTRICAAVGV